MHPLIFYIGIPLIPTHLEITLATIYFAGITASTLITAFRANCLSTAYDFELAIRDIQPGEQLTDDYGYLNIDTPFRARDEGTKRKTVYPDDLLKYYKVWDKKLRVSFKNLLIVNQPLSKFIDSEKWNKMCEIALGKSEMDSILNCYFDGAKE